METIGLDFNDMVNLHASVSLEARKSIEEDTQLSFARYISQGRSEDEARFRANLTAEVASATTAILTVIDANNKQTLSNLKKAGLFVC